MSTLILQVHNSITMALFIFAVISLMLSLAYWFTYSLIRPEGRMPFAANEIGEIAWFLLLSAVLESIFQDSHISAKKEIAFTILFVVASVSLWIGWSGEWVQDIISGFGFGYFLCACARSLKQSDAFGKKEWILMGMSCSLIILCQAGTFFVSEAAKQPLDYFCYLLMFALLIWLFVKLIGMAKGEKNEKAMLAMSFSVCAFSYSTLYMSSGWFYIAAFLLCLAAMPFMLMALRREVLA